MEKKKLRMQLKDNYANISGVSTKYFMVQPVVGTPTLPHLASGSRSPWNRSKRGRSFISHALLSHLAQRPTCSPEVKRLTLTGSAAERMRKQATQDKRHKWGGYHIH